jgi:DNA-binding NarL/FixJ family response regulator
MQPLQITERDRNAAKKLINTFDLNPSDEDRIAEMIAKRIADGDIGQFIDDLQKLRRRSPNDLTEREMEIVSAAGRGLSIEEMAQRLRMPVTAGLRWRVEQ